MTLALAVKSESELESPHPHVHVQLQRHFSFLFSRTTAPSGTCASSSRTSAIPNAPHPLKKPLPILPVDHLELPIPPPPRRLPSHYVQRRREFVSRKKQPCRPRQTTRVSAHGEEEKNTNTARAVLRAKRIKRACSVSDLWRIGAVSACGVSCGTSSSSPPSFHLDYLLFLLGKDEECSCFGMMCHCSRWKDTKRAERAGPTPGFLDIGDACLGMEKQIHLGWQ